MDKNFFRLNYCNLKTIKFIKDSLKEDTIERQGILHIYIHIIVYKYGTHGGHVRT